MDKTVEIVILAMIAAFLGLRLYAVLGRRAEHEEEVIQGRRPAEAPRVPGGEAADRAPQPVRMPIAGVTPAIERGLREIAAADFFQGFFTTALQADELVLAVRFQRPRRSAYAKFKHPASGYAMAGVFLADLGAAGLRVAVTGAAGGVFRWAEAEAAWAAGRAAPELDHPDLLDDIHAPARYRGHLARLMFEQALRDLA